MKVAIMTDSTAYIPTEMRKKHHIHMIPLSVVFGEQTYGEEIDLTATEFYNKLREFDKLPTTSQPSIGLIIEKLEALREEYDAVISIHLSSGISGTYQAVLSAGEMVEGIDVYAYDSEVSAIVQGFYALEAAEMAVEKKAPELIIERLDKMKESMRAYFMVDNLSNLHRGGRLSGAQALVGGVLQIKPILHFENKVIVPFEKIRTRKKALNRIVSMLEAEAEKGKELKVAFIHGNDEETAIHLRDAFLEKYPNIETVISYFGPVIGTHLGEGAIGIGWYEK